MAKPTPTNFALFNPLQKIGEGWWRCLHNQSFMPHIGSKRWHTFYLATIGGFVTLGADD